MGNIINPDFSRASAQTVHRYNRSVDRASACMVLATFGALLFVASLRTLDGGETILGIGNTPDPLSRFMRHHFSDIIYAFGAVTFANSLDAGLLDKEKRPKPVSYGHPLAWTAGVTALGVGYEYLETLSIPDRHYDFVDLASYAAGGLLYTLVWAGVRSLAYGRARRTMRRELAA